MAEEAFSVQGKISIDGQEEAKKSLDQISQEVQKANEKIKATQKQSPSVLQPADIAKNITGGLQKFESSNFFRGLSSIVSTPGASFAEGDVGSSLLKTGLQTALPAIASAIGTPITGAVVKGLTTAISPLIDNLLNQQKMVEKQAGQAVRSRIGGLAARGLEVSDQEISQLLEMERARAQRMMDAMKQVAKVQDETSNTLEGMLSSTLRRGLDALIG